MTNGTKQSLSDLHLPQLPAEQQAQTKGGLLIYCEEKRRNVRGRTYTTMQWRVVNDGRLWVTVRP